MSTIQNSIETLKQLISFASVSSTSNVQISECVSGQLKSLGFEVESSEYLDDAGTPKVNLVARRNGTKNPTGGLAYFCHTDVVPADGWTGPGGDPFSPVTQDDRIYGRGSCDMKGSLVAMLAAAQQVDVAQQSSPLWIVCTADEEVGFEGAKCVVNNSTAYRELVNAQPMGIIGEPTRLSVVHAHKGITGFQITSHGRAAHSSLSSGINANEAMVPMLQTLLEIGQRTRDDTRYHDNRFDPPVLSWNFGVNDGSTAVNITPQKSVAWVSLRSMPNIDGEDLIAEVRSKADELGLEFKRFSGGSPLWIDADADGVESMCQLAGGQPKTVCYGTDGGEFTELDQLVVCGPGDIAQAHTTDEFLEMDQLSKGIQLYAAAIRHWCCEND